MAKQKLFKVTLIDGNIGLTAANTLGEARKIAFCENGTNNLRHVEVATEEDIEWVNAMNGYVPKLEGK